MAWLRTMMTLVLTGLIAGPFLFVLLELIRHPEAFRAWAEFNRLSVLCAHTAGLALGAIVVAVPLGSILGLVLNRSRFRGRELARGLMTLALFIPVPVMAVAWQIILGHWLPDLSMMPGEIAWRPWRQGLIPAALVHGIAGIPWVAWIVGSLLQHRDPGLEDQARLEGGERSVLIRVLLPRIGLAAMVSAAMLAVQTSTDITITDAMMVRTLAEEVYTQMVGFPDGVPAALAFTVPVWLAACVLTVLLTNWLIRKWPTGEESLSPVANGRAMLVPLVWLVVGSCVVLPALALIWKAGGGGTITGFSGEMLIRVLRTNLTLSASTLAGSLSSSLVTAFLTTAIAWWFCDAMFDRPRRSSVLLIGCVLVALTPGPLIGFGLKDVIFSFMDAERWLQSNLGVTFGLRPLLYDRPSPVPGIWAGTIRFFPFAVAMLAPAFLAIPRELRDEFRLEGGGFRARFRRLTWPLTQTAAIRSVAVVSGLVLGEVSASKLVAPPGYRTYILDLFDQMHYGTEATVAGLALILIVVVGLGVLASSAITGSPDRPRSRNSHG